MLENLKEALKKNKILIEKRIDDLFIELSKDKNISKISLESAKYSLKSDSKYIRSFLILNSGFFSEEVALDFALAIELVHTYSLLHDDLPAMDNDDYRRGKLSNHKKFDEATAILTGDGYLSLAFEVIMNSDILNDEQKVISAGFLAKNSGFSGMVGGQFFDLQLQGQIKKTDDLKNDFDAVKKTGMLKTGKLFEFCITLPFLISHNKIKIERSKEIAKDIGDLFQIVDDFLDIDNLEEVNFVSVLGVEKAREYNSRIVEKLQVNISKLYGKGHIFLDLVRFLESRKK